MEEALTKDVTTLEAIFDLVDNSIDAARDWLIANKCNRGKDNLPLTYDGFYVCIRIDEDSIRVLDNCAGIDRETLTKRALYTNKPSQHEYGIGLYGIGLKRSLLKMGTDFSFMLMMVLKVSSRGLIIEGSEVVRKTRSMLMLFLQRTEGSHYLTFPI